MRTAFAIAAGLLLLAVASPAADAADSPVPETQCMPVYQEYDLGIVRIVRPNSCTTHIWVLGEQIL